jgi:16S rRNA (cytosine967-C5)-methyltransferase
MHEPAGPPQYTAALQSSDPAALAPPLAEVLQAAARVWRAFDEGQSLDRAIAAQVPADEVRLRPAVHDLAYHAVRRRALTQAVISALAARPPAAAVEALLAVALPQLLLERHASHTVVDQAVTAARAQAVTAPAAGFVNALLRNFLRQRSALLARLESLDEIRYNAPRWWLEAMREAQPAHWREILATAGEAPPLVLRVNPARVGVTDYLARLRALDIEATRVGVQAVWLHRPLPVTRIPGFEAGDVSVQDAGAQLAADWLDAGAGMRVLDACAAPGGKTTHLAELAAIELTALEVDAGRARRIDDNLQRTGLRASVIVGDAARPADWWDGRPFQRILLDAPCSASGIVRRHPDIPWLRRPADVAQLATLQGQLLEALWPLLEVGGRLLYVVCSVFPQEGSRQVARFVGRHPAARLLPLPGGSPVVELLPTAAGAATWSEGQAWPTMHDGFTYALLEKSR